MQRSLVVALQEQDQGAVRRLLHLFQAGQQVVGQHRCQSDRGDQAGQDGDDVADRERREHQALDPRQPKQREEDQHHDQGGVEDPGSDLDGGVRDHLQNRPRLGQLGVLLQAPDDILDPDHGVVDQLADGDRQPPQRHRIDRHVEQPEDQDGDDEGHRNRGQRDRRGAEIEQKQEQRDGNDGNGLLQHFTQVVDRSLDELRLPEHDLVGVDALGQIGPQLGQHLLDVLGQPNGVYAGLFHQPHHHGGLAHVAAVAALHPGLKFHLGDLLQQDGAAVDVVDDQVSHAVEQPFQVRLAADVQDEEAAAMMVDGIAAGVGVVAADGRFHIAVRDVEKVHHAQVGRYPELARLATDDQHLGHARDRHQPWPKKPVGEVPERHHIARIAGDRDGKGHAHGRADRRHLRLDIGRKLVLDDVHSLRDQLAAAVNVGAELEIDEDDGERGGRDRAHPLDILQPLHRRLDGEGDAALHLLGRQPLALGDQRDRIAVDLGQHVDGHLLHLIVAQHE